jgi:hypothetical protein
MECIVSPMRNIIKTELYPHARIWRCYFPPVTLRLLERRLYSILYYHPVSDIYLENHRKIINMRTFRNHCQGSGRHRLPVRDKDSRFRTRHLPSHGTVPCCQTGEWLEHTIAWNPEANTSCSSLPSPHDFCAINLSIMGMDAMLAPLRCHLHLNHISSRPKFVHTLSHI